MPKQVPKCKNCDCHWDIPVCDYSERNEHYCHWWKMSSFKGDGGTIDIMKTGFCATDGKFIKAYDCQTSPKWCPKR